MKKNRKRIVTVLMILALVAAYAGGYWTARYQYRQSWVTITKVIRESGDVEVKEMPSIIPTKMPIQ